MSNFKKKKKKIMRNSIIKKTLQDLTIEMQINNNFKLKFVHFFKKVIANMGRNVNLFIKNF